MTQTQTFLAEIEAFLVRSGMSASTFGHKVANEGKFVTRLREGRSVTLETADRVRRFIAEYVNPSASSKRRGNEERRRVA